MAVKAIAMLHVLKGAFLLGVVDAAEVAEPPFFLYGLHKIPLDAYDCSLFLAVVGICSFFVFVAGGVDAVWVAVVLVGAGRGHFGDILLFVLDGPGDLAFEGVLIAQIGLHLPDGRG